MLPNLIVLFPKPDFKCEQYIIICVCSDRIQLHDYNACTGYCVLECIVYIPLLSQSINDDKLRESNSVGVCVILYVEQQELAWGDLLRCPHWEKCLVYMVKLLVFGKFSNPYLLFFSVRPVIKHVCTLAYDPVVPLQGSPCSKDASGSTDYRQ